MIYKVAPYKGFTVEIEQLLPCPKCGKHPSQEVGIRYNGVTYAVCCGGEGCCFYTESSGIDEAIKAWNRRACNE